MADTIIWDLDGTLLNTLDDLCDSVNYALTQYHLPTRDRMEIRRFLGNGIRNLIGQSVPENISETVFDEIFQTFRTYYMGHCQIKTKPYEGIPETLAELKKANYKMAIVSNKIQGAVTDLQKQFFSDYISVAIGESEGIRRKPAPDMVHKAMELLHSSEKSTIYVGDSEVDLQTAANSGIKCISVLWGFRDEDFLIQKGAETFAKCPQDIIGLLSQPTPSNA